MPRRGDSAQSPPFTCRERVRSSASFRTRVKEVGVDSIWLWPLGLMAFLLAWPGLRALAVRLLGDRLRTQALTEQPDRIYLVRVEEPHCRNPLPHQSADRHLPTAGFVAAGIYLVREMPELTLAMYANPAESAYAVVYDHPRSGFWAEFVTRYQDGTLATYTTPKPLDVDVPEGSLHVSAPNVPLADLWQRMLAERATKPMLPCERASAPRDFERGYAESVAYHKQLGKLEAPPPAPDDEDEMKQAA